MQLPHDSYFPSIFLLNLQVPLEVFDVLAVLATSPLVGADYSARVEALRGTAKNPTIQRVIVLFPTYPCTCGKAIGMPSSNENDDGSSCPDLGLAHVV